jgi:hypothetical protein
MRVVPGVRVGSTTRVIQGRAPRFGGRSYSHLIFGYYGTDYGGFTGADFSYDVDQVSGHYIHVETVQDHGLSVEDVGVFKMDERKCHKMSNSHKYNQIFS